MKFEMSGTERLEYATTLHRLAVIERENCFVPLRRLAYKAADYRID